MARSMIEIKQAVRGVRAGAAGGLEVRQTGVKLSLKNCGYFCGYPDSKRWVITGNTRSRQISQEANKPRYMSNIEQQRATLNIRNP